jgi:hypothetical protein
LCIHRQFFGKSTHLAFYRSCLHAESGKAINISVRAEFTTIGIADPVSGSFQNVGKHDNVDTLAAPEMMLTITSNPVDRQILKPFNNSIPAVIRMQFFD